jgi:cation diffusion facilitator CzcD-associated flavoprotein CzcO
MSENRRESTAEKVDVVVVGAGFAGMYAVVKLRGLGLSVQGFEAGGDVGGTWYWNRYPGARCDIESMEYSYAFDDALQQEWHWPERYSAQPEILRYANHVADRFDLRRSFCFNTRIASATWDDASGRWRVVSDAGRTIVARFLMMCTGCLSEARKPAIEGAETFAGLALHTGRWPHTPVDLKGQRVGVFGTGSSGIQVITALAGVAAQLYVFQRTPGFTLPSRNRPLDPVVERRVKADYASLRKRARESFSGNAAYPVPTQSAFQVDGEERARIYSFHYDAGRVSIGRAFTDLLTDRAANETASAYVRARITGLVRDPETARTLTPTYLIGTKRVCLDSGYYEAFNRDDVTLVDLRREPIERIAPEGVLTSKRDIPLDAIVYATGFDAMTGALDAIDIRGRDGRALKAEWADGPRTLLGVQSAGFPNLFFVTGPGSPSVLSNVIVCIEQHVDWIAGALAHLRARGLDQMEATEQAQEAWVSHVNEVAAKTLFPETASWYMGANVPGKARVFMPYVGGVGPFRVICDRVAAEGYEGFAIGRIGARPASEATPSTQSAPFRQ